ALTVSVRRTALVDDDRAADTLVIRLEPAALATFAQHTGDARVAALDDRVHPALRTARRARHDRAAHRIPVQRRADAARRHEHVFLTAGVHEGEAAGVHAEQPVPAAPGAGAERNPIAVPLDAQLALQHQLREHILDLAPRCGTQLQTRGDLCRVERLLARAQEAQDLRLAGEGTSHMGRVILQNARPLAFPCRRLTRDG